MTPQDTNHDSLSIYYDFLEESGVETSELRESLTGNVNKWHYVYVDDFHDVGVIYEFYILEFDKNGVGGCHATLDIMISGIDDVTLHELESVGSGYLDTVGSFDFSIKSNGVGSDGYNEIF